MLNTLFAAAFLMSPVVAASDDESQIKALYGQMCKAMVQKDMATMNEIHDDDFQLVHMTGSRMNKKEYLDAVKDGTLNYYSMEHDEIFVTVDGDSATLKGKSRVNAAVYGGVRHTWRLQQDMKRQREREGDILGGINVFLSPQEKKQ